MSREDERRFAEVGGYGKLTANIKALEDGEKMTEAQEVEADRGHEISFRVTQFRKLKKGEEGVTRIETERLRASTLLTLVYELLATAAPDSITVIDDEAGTSLIGIDWNKVPMGIRSPRFPGREVM